jgi:hypothetical protein
MENDMTVAVDARNIATTYAAPAPRPLHVVVIGAGIGGLALAQGLRKAGVGVAVYERDRAPTDRVQGYRLHINPTGSAALHACLPPHLFDAFARTCGKPTKGIRFVTERANVLLALETPHALGRPDPIAQHRSVSRITLRQVLLSGLGGVVHFGKHSYATRKAPMAASSRISTTARRRQATSWSPPTAAARGRAGNCCRWRSASTRGFSELPARSSSTNARGAASLRNS